MSTGLEYINGEDLSMLVSELMTRKGYTVEHNPQVYKDIEVVAVRPNDESDISKYFVVTAGRGTSDYLTKSDVDGALPEPLMLSDSSQLLLVTTRRSSSREARRIVSTDPTPKTVWYVGNLIEELRSVNSQYLIDLYDADKYQFNDTESLRERFEYQDIIVTNEEIDYIASKTYHPRKVISFIELSHYGHSTYTVDSTAVDNFLQDTSP